MPYVAHPRVDITHLSEALDLMTQKMPSFGAFGVTRVRAWPMDFPNFTSMTLVSIWSPLDSCGNGVVIQTASAQEFLARKALSPGLHRFPIQAIHEATIDEIHNITLEDGTHVYDVRLAPQYPLGDLTAAEWKALQWALSFHEHRKATTGLSRKNATSIQPMFIHAPLDYAELREKLEGFELRGLKELVGFAKELRAKNPALPYVATETLRSALQKSGLRKPKFERTSV
jgi:hypothetical protein